MKKLIIDMDDVLCEKVFLRMVNAFLGTDDIYIATSYAFRDDN